MSDAETGLAKVTRRVTTPPIPRINTAPRTMIRATRRAINSAPTAAKDPSAMADINGDAEVPGTANTVVVAPSDKEKLIQICVQDAKVNKAPHPIPRSTFRLL
jgi:hypothetical protein